MVQALQEEYVQCPYCGETISILIDGSVEQQEYIEDCEVCCRPITFIQSVTADGLTIDALHENE